MFLFISTYYILYLTLVGNVNKHVSQLTKNTMSDTRQSYFAFFIIKAAITFLDSTYFYVKQTNMLVRLRSTHSVYFVSILLRISPLRTLTVVFECNKFD